MARDGDDGYDDDDCNDADNADDSGSDDAAAAADDDDDDDDRDDDDAAIVNENESWWLDCPHDVHGFTFDRSLSPVLSCVTMQVHVGLARLHILLRNRETVARRAVALAAYIRVLAFQVYNRYGSTRSYKQKRPRSAARIVFGLRTGTS